MKTLSTLKITKYMIKLEYHYFYQSKFIIELNRNRITINSCIQLLFILKIRLSIFFYSAIILISTCYLS